MRIVGASTMLAPEDDDGTMALLAGRRARAQGSQHVELHERLLRATA
jgi:hypothetical protein